MLNSHLRHVSHVSHVNPPGSAETANTEQAEDDFIQLGNQLDSHFEDPQHLERLTAAFVRAYLRVSTTTSATALPQVRKKFKKLLYQAEIKKNRIYIINQAVVAKINDVSDGRDDTPREAAIGLVLNNLRINRLSAPNFVYTMGAFQSPLILRNSKPPHGFQFDKNYNYVVTEYVRGDHLARFRDKKSLPELMPLFLQIFFALRLAFLEYGFTHYDLHGGNVIIRKIPGGKRAIVYPWGTVMSEYYATIIDPGRSYAMVQGRGVGRVIEKHTVSVAPSAFYDIYFVLERVLPRNSYSSPDVQALFKFFRMQGFSKDVYADMPIIVRSNYNWDEFVEVLYKLNSTKNCLSRNNYTIPRPLGTGGGNAGGGNGVNRNPTPSTTVLATVPAPVNPTSSELNLWFRKTRKTADMRRELLFLIEKDQKRVQTAVRLVNTATHNTVSPAVTGLDLEAIREQQQDQFLIQLEQLVNLTKSQLLRPVLTQVVEYYRKRKDNWNSLLIEMFAG